MRVKLHDASLRKVAFGITPAHAGKTYQLRLDLFHQRDHPRACG